MRWLGRVVAALCISLTGFFVSAAESLSVEVQADATQVFSGDTVNFSVAVVKASNGKPANLGNRKVEATFPNASTPVTLANLGNSTFTYSAVTQGSGTQTLTVTVKLDAPQAEAALLNQIAQTQADIAALQAELAQTTKPGKRLALQIRILVKTALLQALQGILAQLRAPLATGSASIQVAAAPQLSITSPADGQFVKGSVNVAVHLASTLPGKARLVVDGTAGALVAVGSADFSLPLDAAALADGAHTVKAEFIMDAFPARVFASPQISVKADNTAPALGGFAPADGSFANQKRPALSGTYSDGGSGVETATLSVLLDGQAVLATPNAGGWSFNPSADLGEGSHTVKFSVADKAGNSSTATWSFFVDSVRPAISGLSPADGSATQSKRPVVSASFSDPAPSSGVNTASIHVVLDGVDVTDQATVTATGATFTPPADLSEGAHALTISLADKAGNSASASSSFSTDNTPPTISSVSPADGAFVKSATPTLSAAFSDSGSGVNAASVQVKVDGSPVSATATATGYSFVPGSALSEGSHGVEVSVADRAGNVSTNTSSFFVDSVSPVVTLVSPGITNNRRPTSSGIFSDAAPSSGIDVASFSLVVDGQDFTGDATVSASGFSWTPSQDLSEGPHTVSGSIADKAGNAKTFGFAFTTDYTPPAAPVIANVVVTADRATVSGPTEPDVVQVIATADGANVESAVIASFVVVFAKTDGQTFTGHIQLKDAAGNLSPVTTQQFSFADTGNPPPAVSISEFNLTVPDGKKKLADGDATLTDSTSATVTFAVSGGTAPFSASVNGASATPVGSVGNIFQATLDNLPEGAQEIDVFVFDGAGQTASLAKPLVVDATPPDLRILTLSDAALPDPAQVPLDAPGLSPSELTTAPLGFLFLNGLSAQDSANVRSDPQLPRKVFAKTGFSLLSRASDAFSSIDPDSVRVQIHEVDGYGSDSQFPFLDYNAFFAPGIPAFIHSSPPLIEVPPAVLASPDGKVFSLGASQVASGLPDSYRTSGTAILYKIYLLTVRASDRLGNEGIANFCFKVDTAAPKILYAGPPKTFDPGTPTKVLGPLESVTAEFDTVRAWDAGNRPLVKAWNPARLNYSEPGSPWLLAEPVELSFWQSQPTTGQLTLEDAAGNKAASSYSAYHENSQDGGYYEVTTAVLPITGSEFGGTFLLQDGASVAILRAGRQYDPNNNPFPTGYVNVLYPIESKGLAPERIVFNDILVDGGNFVAKTPSWSGTRSHTVGLSGDFPYQPFALRFPENFPDLSYTAPDGTTGTYNAQAVDLQTKVALTIKDKSKLLSLAYPSEPSIAGFSNSFDLSPSATSTPPGLQAVALNYSEGASAFPPQLPPAPYYFTEFQLSSGVEKPRALTVMEVTPDTLVAGQQTRVRIRGYFGDDVKPGDLVSVSFSPSSGAGAGTGTINIVPMDASGNPDPNGTPVPTGNGRVVFEDTFNATVFQTVEVLVEPSVDDPTTPDMNESALGIFDVTVGGQTLQKTLNVIRFEIVTPELSSNGQWTGNLIKPQYVLSSNPVPIVHLDPISEGAVILNSQGNISLTVSGYIEDRLADVVKNGNADIDSVSISANGQSLANVALNRDVAFENANKSLIRPFAYRSQHFSAPISFPAKAGLNAITVVTSNNAANNAGFANLPISVSQKNLSIGNQATIVAENLVYNVFLPNGVSDATQDSLQFFFGVREARIGDLTIQETGVATNTFTGMLPGIGQIEFRLTAIEAGSLIGSTTITLASGMRWTASGTMQETSDGSHLFRLSTSVVVTPDGLPTTFSLTPAGDLSNTLPDTIGFAVEASDGQLKSGTLFETGPNTKIFTGNVPGLGTANFTLDLTSPTNPPYLTMTGSISVTLDSGGTLSMTGTFQETGRSGQEDGRFIAEIITSGTSQLAFNIALPASFNAPNAPDNIVFYTGDRNPIGTDPILVETSNSSSVFTGTADGFELMQVSISNFAGQTPQIDTFTAVVTLKFSGSTVATVITGNFIETTPTSGLFRLVSTSQQSTGGKTSSSSILALDAIGESSYFGGGTFTPLLVRVEISDELKDKVFGQFLDPNQDYNIVEATVNGQIMHFFGQSPPTIFARVLSQNPEKNLPTIEAILGKAAAQLKVKAGGAALAEAINTAVKVTLTYFVGDKGGASDVEFFKNFKNAESWKNIKMVTFAGANSDDNKLHICANISGLETLNKNDPTRIQKFPVRLYRMFMNDPLDDDGTYKNALTQMFSRAAASSNEPNGAEVLDLDLDFITNIDGGNSIYGSRTIDLKTETKLQPTGVPSFAAIDGDVKKAQPGNEADAFAFGEALKQLGFVNRGVAHPNPGLLANDPGVPRSLAIEDLKDALKTAGADSAGASFEWGRPYNNAEFVISTGTEKLVVTARVFDAQDNTWHFPAIVRKFDGAMDQILVRAPADLFYFSGHALIGASQNRRLKGALRLNENQEPNVFIGADEIPIPENPRTDETLDISTKWKRDELRMKWFIVAGCFVLNEDNEEKWCDKSEHQGSSIWGDLMLNNLGLHGILGWSKKGWSGSDFSRDFVKFASQNSVATEVLSSTGSTVIVDKTFVVDAVVNAGDQIIADDKIYIISSVEDAGATSTQLTVTQPFAPAIQANSLIKIKGSITRGWKQAWRSPDAKKRFAKVMDKQPAYEVFEPFEKNDILAPSGMQSAKGNKDEMKVYFWEAKSTGDDERRVTRPDATLPTIR